MASAYTDLTTRFTYKMLAAWGDMDDLAENDRYLKDNGWQDSTAALFYQASAPTGWTKVATQNDKIIRVTSGSGGSAGGSQALSTPITLAHTHTITSDPGHTHDCSAHTHVLDSTTDESGFGSADWLTGAGASKISKIGGSGTSNVLTNSFGNATATLTSSSAGSHDHGGATQSSLTDLSLAYIDVLLCTKDSGSGYTDLTTTFSHNLREVYDYLSQLAGNDSYLVNRLTPSGSVALFFQAAASTGWTKLTTQDGKACRVVSGTGGGTGGTTDIATVITLAHANNITNDGSHSHTFGGHRHNFSTTSITGAGGAAAVPGFYADDGSGFMRETNNSVGTRNVLMGQTAADGSGSTATESAHNHTTGSSLNDQTLFYVNVIQCSKDSAGSSSVYTDMTTFFVDQALLAWQDLDKLAENDAYMKFHTIPAASVMFFYQASAPLTWTKQTTHDDKALRIVSGSGGGSGGGTGISAGLTLVHAHTIGTYTSVHSINAHTHALDTASETNAASLGTNYAYSKAGSPNAGSLRSMDPSGTTQDITKMKTSTVNGASGTTDGQNHNHGGSTGSALSNVTLAYISTIMCSKN